MNKLCESKVLFEVNNFLSLREIITFSICSKMIFQCCIREDSFWKHMVQQRTAPIFSHEIDQDFLSSINMSTYHDFYAIFHESLYCPFTYYAKLPNYSSGNFGELYVLEIYDKYLYLKEVSADGTCNCSALFTFYPRTKAFVILGVSETWVNEFQTKLSFLQNSLLLTAASCSSHVVSEYAALPNNINLHGKVESAILSDISNTLGLVTGKYGSHGLEILHIGLYNSIDDPFPKPSTDIGKLHLRGLKIKGDPNVPGWELSFAIDLTLNYHIDQTIAADNRIVLNFNTVTQIIDIDTRRVHISKWYRGFGQINRIPGTWQPEFEPCSMIVYNKPLSSSESGGVPNVLFSILWEMPGEDFRHMIDYNALPGRKTV